MLYEQAQYFLRTLHATHLPFCHIQVTQSERKIRVIVLLTRPKFHIYRVIHKSLREFLRHALQRVSQELDYRIDICRVTKGAHIENL
jgi:hypothetical protein